MARMLRNVLSLVFVTVILIVYSVGSTAPALAQTGPTVVVSTGAINIRSGPAHYTTSLGTAPAGAELPVTGRNEGTSWWRVQTPYGVGWVSAELVIFRGLIDAVPIVTEPVGTLETPTVIVDRFPATVYTNPNRDSFIIGIAPTGLSLIVTGKTFDGNWFQVSTELGTGFVNAGEVALRGEPKIITVVGDPGPSFDGPTVRVNVDTPVSSTPGGAVIGTLPAGTTLPTGGRSADNSWWQVAPPLGIGWIPVSNISLAGAANNIRATSNATTPGPAYTGAAVATIIIESPRKVAYDKDSFDSAPMWDAFLGEQGSVVGRSLNGLWLKVTLRGFVGWINFSGISLQGNMAAIPVIDTTPPPAHNVAVVNIHRLNIRSGPGVEYTDLGSVPGGTTLTVTGRHPTLPWLRVESDFGVGWVRIMYIIFRGEWTQVPPVTEPVGTISQPVALTEFPRTVYSEHALDMPIVGQMPAGTYPVIGRTRDGKWALISETPLGDVWIPYNQGLFYLQGIEELIPFVD